MKGPSLFIRIQLVIREEATVQHGSQSFLIHSTTNQNNFLTAISIPTPPRRFLCDYDPRANDFPEELPKNTLRIRVVKPLQPATINPPS